jgi:hypothetical protein
MRKVYLNLLIGVVFLLCLIYFIQQLTIKLNKTETFIPRIRGVYRPYIRVLNKHYETFADNYGLKVIHNKLRKWNFF